MAGISQAEFAHRRRQLLGAMAPGTIAIIPGGGLFRRDGDAAPRFRQDSDFWYLTGFTEPGAMLVLRRHPLDAGNEQPGKDEAILFCQARQARDELYNGERLGPERAAQALGVDAAFPASALEDHLPALVGAAEAVHCSLGEEAGFDRRLLGWLAAARAQGLDPTGEVRNLKVKLHQLRLCKSKAELKLMRKAAAITVDAHLRALKRCRAGLTEADLEAELLYACRRGGAQGMAYPPIVAAGANACVLHYTANSAALNGEDLVLIDAGCEYQHYAADLTRTFPVGGRFTAVQETLYAIVLEAQRQAIAACQPGASFAAPDEAALGVMEDGLQRLGLQPPLGEGEAGAQEAGRHPFCPHGTSHWLGLDVHDCGGDRPVGLRTLEPGMVLTVEPGLYIPSDAQGVAAPWLGTGVRIEDDVLITASAPEVLTEGAPKEVAELERAMARG